MADAWIREAQEASKLVEDIETRVKNKNPSLNQQEKGFVDITGRSKLLEAGIKLDRLESLLRNPSSKPILTNEDLVYRWMVLSDMQQRTKALALSLYALPTPSRLGCLTPGNAKATNSSANSYEQDGTKMLLSKDDPQLCRPLILCSSGFDSAQCAGRSPNDALQTQAEMKQCGTFASLSLVQKVFWIFSAVVGLAALIFVLFLICAVI